MSKKAVKKLKKRLKKQVLATGSLAQNQYDNGFKTGFGIGADVARARHNMDLAESVIAPITRAAIDLIDAGLEDYACALLEALNEKANEIAAGDEADHDEGCDECAGRCEDCQPDERDGDAFAASFDAPESLVAQLQRGTADHIEPVQDGRDPM